MLNYKAIILQMIIVRNKINNIIYTLVANSDQEQYNNKNEVTPNNKGLQNKTPRSLYTALLVSLEQN